MKAKLKSRSDRARRATRVKASTPPPIKAGISIGHEALANSRVNPRRRRAQASARMVPMNELFPPALIKAIGTNQMAMDEAISSSAGWTEAAYIGAFEEGQTFLGYPTLSILAQRPEYRRAVETIAKHMTRKWIKFSSKSGDEAKADKMKQLEDELQRFNVKAIFRELAEQDGFFGRTHLYIDLGSGDDSAEEKTAIGTGRDGTSKAKIKKGSLKAFRTVEPVWCYPTQYNSSNPLAADWYKPQVWFAMSREIHATRLLTFIGREVPDLLKPTYAFGGLSLTQMAKPYVDNWLTTRQSVNDLIKAFSVMVLKTSLLDQLTSDPSGAKLLERLDFFNNNRDNRGVMAIDKDKEDFANVSASLSGLDKLQAQALEHIASIFGMPLIIYLGLSPAGLNASGDDEIRVWNDNVHADQERVLRPNLQTVVDIVQVNKWGSVDEDIVFEFVPLHEPDKTSEADRKLKKAQTDKIYYDMGAVSADEIGHELANDPDSGYSIKREGEPEAPLPQDELLEQRGEGPQKPPPGTAAQPGATP